MKQAMTGWDVLKSYLDLPMTSTFSLMGLVVSWAMLGFSDTSAVNMAYTWMSVMS